MKSYPITPIPKPRMVRSDSWKKRPAVMRYWAFKDKVRELGIELQSPCKITFYIEMPKSWSKKKRDEWCGKPHMNKPDGDNLEKGLLDSVFDDDAHMWAVSWEKRWAVEGSITVESWPIDVYLP